MKSIKSILLLTTIITLFLCISTASATLLTNGDFENLTDTEKSLIDGHWNWYVFDSIEGWTTVDGDAGIEVQKSGTITNEAGNLVYGQNGSSYYVELDSHYANDTNSAMYQTVHLTTGEYLLEFYYQPRTYNLDDNEITVTLAGQSYTISGSLTDWGNTGWLYVSYSFLIESDGDYDLIFAATGETSSTYGGFIDSISLTPVPEPASIFLLGIGLLAVATIGRKKMQK